jgi:hypothetical protein
MHRTGRTSSILSIFLAAVALLAGIGHATAQEAAEAPPPLVVSADVSEAYPRVAVRFEGSNYDPKANRLTPARAEFAAALMPGVGQRIEFVLSVAAGDADKTVAFRGQILDYTGQAILPVEETVTARAGTVQKKSIGFTPNESHRGPFYLRANWVEQGGDAKGEIEVRAGQPNRRVVVEDFEVPNYPEPGGPIESTAAAARGGKLGLIVRVPEPPAPPANADPKAPRPLVAQRLPLGLRLPGRPVTLAMWVKNDQPSALVVHIIDPGIEAHQRNVPDTWTIGPIELAPGDWRRVEIPMPGFSRPKAQRAPHNEASGVVDYPLTVQWIDVYGHGREQVLIDEIEVLTQGEPEDAIALRPITDKPLQLLYRNDTVRLSVANTWLWGELRTVRLSAGLEDAFGAKRPLVDAEVTLAPGGVKMLDATVSNLPLGAYDLKAAASEGEKVVAVTPPMPAYLVYEPKAGPLPARELRSLLKDRNQLLVDLGFEKEVVIIPWHSTDNSPSVEPAQGAWAFEWITPSITARKDAGLSPVGLLGFSPLWADPSATYNRKMAFWYGSTYAMPSRSIYWEEYVYRTVEHFKGTIDTWVVWDRPDSEAFKATPEVFAEQMLEVARDAAREANPNAKLISGGVSRENIETYLQAIAEVGAHRYLDGIGIYPTLAALSPEDGYLDVILARAQRIREREKIKPELWVMNLGWATGNDQYRVSELEQAIYVPRAYVITRAAGIGNILLQPDRTEAAPKRDSADLIYPSGGLFGLKSAAISARTVRSLLADATPVRELFINDKWDGLVRAYLFRKGGGELLLCVWRREGTSEMPMPVKPVKLIDLFGNELPVGDRVTLRTSPTYVIFPAGSEAELIKGLERTSPIYEDAPESVWKREFNFFLDVGDEADEKRAGYACEGGKLVGPIDSHYHTEYGRHVIDTGRHFSGSESFRVDVSNYNGADMLLRKRINYAVPDQLVRVLVDGEFVGQWFAFKRDRRFRWRDIDFIIPAKYLAGKSTVTLTFEPLAGRQATSYYYWAAPIRTKTVYASDLSLLVSTSGYGAGANRDKNILGGPIRFDKTPDRTYTKGLGVNAAAELPRSVIVIPLNKQFKRFKATVGVDAATNGQGSVRFRIGDGKKMLWDSGDMSFYSEPKDVDIDVSEAILLMLWVGDADDGEKNDIANWADARLELK